MLVSERKNKTDWAHQVCEAVDNHYTKIKKTKLVINNLNTHIIFPCSKLFWQ